MNYENRVVVFIDFLGFEKIIDGAGDEIDKIYNALSYLSRISDGFSATLEPTEDSLKDGLAGNVAESLQMTHFSDSLIISFLASEQNLVYLILDVIQNILVMLINDQFICRGGIAYGKMIHEKNIVFGPALVKAYKAESKAALFPRIILDESIIELAKKNSGCSDPDDEAFEIKENIVTKDTDNMYYIDYFNKAIVKSVSDFSDFNPEKYINNLRKIIEQNKNESKPDLKVKYGWMINKFNFMIEELETDNGLNICGNKLKACLEKI